MNTIKNSVHLIGNLGKDVLITSFDSGAKNANFSLATTEYHKNNKGELHKETQWHNIIAWGKNAELMAKVLQKGSQVAISGSITYRTYDDKSGVSRNMTEIVVSEFQKMNGNTSDANKSEVQVPF